jgi:site-specific recombinase XerD
MSLAGLLSGQAKRPVNACRHLSNFLQEKYHVGDMSFRQLNFAFIEAFDFYLRVGHRMKPNTVLRSIIPLRKMVKIALNRGYIAHDPFAEYKPQRGKSEHRTLTGEELKKIMNTPFHSHTRNLTRDLFVFSAFTGLAYADVKSLTEKELVITYDGNRWIVTARKKTGTVSRIRLLDIPFRIIEKYREYRIGDRIFPVPGYTTVDINLKRIGEICGINKGISFHMARHTFASQVCLSQGVPIETVSRMLGHRDIYTTQIYAAVSTQKISDDMKVLSQRITGKYTLIKQDDNNNIGNNNQQKI